MTTAAPAGRAAEAAEVARLNALAARDVLGTGPEQAFAELTALAERLCAAPLAVVSLVEDAMLWFPPGAGRTPGQARDDALHVHALAAGGVLVVPDTGADPRFAHHPLVVGEPFARSYAGVPLVAADGAALGALCVLDTAPRTLDGTELADLEALARQVVVQLELRRHGAVLAAELTARLVAKAPAQERLRVVDGVLAHTDALVYAKDLTGRFVVTNTALEDTLAVPGGLLGRTDHELFPAAAADVYRTNDTRITASGRREVVTEDLVHPDGSTHTYRSTKFPLTGDDGVVFGLGGVSTDVTELIESRSAHAAAEQRWRALVEHSPVAVAVIGADARFAYANPQAVELYGAQRPEQVVGRRAVEFVPAGSEAATAALFGAVLTGGSPLLGHRWTLRRLGGEELTVEVNAAAVSHDGAPAVQVELRDVTVAAAAQQALAESERRFRALFDDSPVAMALADPAERWVQVNAAFGRLLGRDPAGLVGTGVADHVHPDDHHLLGTPEQVRGGIHQREVRVRRSDGQVRWVWSSLTPTPGPAGQTCTLATALDVTARKDAETALRESEADLAAIARVARCVQDGADPRPVVVSAVHELAEAATVSMVEALDDTTLVVTACEGMAAVGFTVPRTAPSMTSHVWETAEAVFLADAALDPRVDPALLALDRTVSMLWQPVVVGGVVHAILAVTWRHRIASPRSRAVQAVRVIADETGTSLHATRLRRELERSASTDPLTGSLNRRAWDDQLLTVLAGVRETGMPLTVALVDLDHFKAYNDTRGHAAGDVLLRDFAAAVRTTLRKDDVFARWGGEEFVLALPDTTTDQAVLVLDRVRASVPDGRTCSIGHTTWSPGEPITTCIGRADTALYAAKHGGRDRLAHR